MRAMKEAPAAPLLKDGFDAATVRAIAEAVAAAHPGFAADRFTAHCLDGFAALSLMARVHRVAQALHAHLALPFGPAVAVLRQAMGEPGPSRRAPEGITVFRHAPYLQFVAEAGLGEPEAALDALEWMTRHFTGEFAIRPFLQHHLERTLARMQRWCAHPDARVRRLASEGARPLLPWGRRVAQLIAQPALTVPLIDALAGDPDEVVRRSAANHLNDLSRLDAALALEVARRWQARALPDGGRTLQRALRTLVKQGRPEALALLGYAVDAPFVLEEFELDRREVPIGGRLVLCFALRCAPGRGGRACVDYAIGYASGNGRPRRKVFKGTVRELPGGAVQRFAFARDFVVRSTRRLYSGAHRAEVLVNGRVLGALDFELTDGGA
ncbi:3-methyladenine DNA glycosylase AlkC [Caldimonas thermodepolymerans]|jgi:DNA alkylation repair enzyme|uniref:3-methyladenine DNA glycosylase AlkC n=2 Tax=Caldimonas thermodepolymerans TaxID=215580 RepID=A0AA46DCG1_9BURK|nr:3-methyladenine DNA glycosylase AlkC [Caldimonas thermodepolymerans]TCP04988.1 3-methyladenine DNA glycosylase AlkC [Caldimonas thermodepolymerans]